MEPSSHRKPVGDIGRCVEFPLSSGLASTIGFREAPASCLSNPKSEAGGGGGRKYFRHL